ncbi:MAG: HAMP domain-containing protein, partial [Nostocales cyanobacterium]
KAEYEYVFHLTDDQEIIDSATSYLEDIKQTLDMSSFADHSEPDANDMITTLKEPLEAENEQPDLFELGNNGNLDNNEFEFDLKAFGEYEPAATGIEEISANNPFAANLGELEQLTDNSSNLPNNQFSLEDPFAEVEPNQNSKENISELESPFGLEDPFSDLDADDNSNENISELESPFGLEDPFSDLDANDNVTQMSGNLELPAFWQDNISSGETENPNQHSSFSDLESDSEQDLVAINDHDADLNSPFAESNVSVANHWDYATEFNEEENSPDLAAKFRENQHIGKDSDGNLSSWVSSNNWEENIAEELEYVEDPDSATQLSGSLDNNFSSQPLRSNNNFSDNDFDDDDFDVEAFESAFGTDSFDHNEDVNHVTRGENSRNNVEFLDDFEEFNDLGSIPNFDLADDVSYDSMELVSDTREKTGHTSNGNFSEDFSVGDGDVDRDEELFTITGAQEAVPVFTKPDSAQLEPNVSVEQGAFAFFENASLERKQVYVALSAGVASALTAALISFIATNFSPPAQRESVRSTGWAMSLSAGVAGGLTAGFMGNMALKQIRRTTKDLQAQFDAVREGNLNVQATVYSEDELGYLATTFNEMSRVIFMTTNEAQRKAVEQEEAKENLQRQVIRLLDDVEGAARGDLTVQAEVTADVLGAVADAFNLTIQNLRDIVQQVKVA